MTLLKGSTYLALIISSTLLFMMQPWIYSWLVPHFGGGAHLWAAVLVFFQWGVALAYLCAAWGFSRFSARELFFVFVGLAGVAIWQLVDLLTLSPGVTSEVPSFGQELGWLVQKVGAVTLLFAASPLCSKLSGVKRDSSAVETLWMVQRYLRRRACRVPGIG